MADCCSSFISGLRGDLESLDLLADGPSLWPFPLSYLLLLTGEPDLGRDLDLSTDLSLLPSKDLSDFFWLSLDLGDTLLESLLGLLSPLSLLLSLLLSDLESSLFIGDLESLGLLLLLRLSLRSSLLGDLDLLLL